MYHLIIQMDSNKLLFSYEDIVRNIRRTSKSIIESFSPDYIIAIGGGGLAPARILREFIDIPIFVVTAKSYSGTVSKELKIHQWLDERALSEVRGKKVLIVDEIYDTGKTLSLLAPEFEKLEASQLGLYVLHQKRKHDRWLETNPPQCIRGQEPLPSVYEPYFCGEKIEDLWVVYPWEDKNYGL